MVHLSWTTHTALPFPSSLQALDTNGEGINARQFHPLFGVIVSGPGGAINTDVPNVSLRSLSANNFHWSIRRLDAASGRAHRIQAEKQNRRDLPTERPKNMRTANTVPDPESGNAQTKRSE